MKQALFLDDEQERHDAFAKVHGNEYQILHARTVSEFLRLFFLYPGKFDLVSLDHDLGNDNLEGNGTIIAWLLAYVGDNIRPRTIVIHSHNLPAGDRMESILRNAGYENIIREPFHSGKAGVELHPAIQPDEQ